MTKIYYNVKSNNIEKAHGVAAIITDSGSVDLGSNPGGPVFSINRSYFLLNYKSNVILIHSNLDQLQLFFISLHDI